METVFFSLVRTREGIKTVDAYNGSYIQYYKDCNAVESVTKYLEGGGVTDIDLEVYDTQTVVGILNENDFNSDVALVGSIDVLTPYEFKKRERGNDVK